MLPFNFNHLYYFYVVAQKGGFSHAANELGISQSAISVQIKQFEQVVGHQLFIRGKGGVELTDSGQILFQFAEEVFGDVDRVLAALAAIEHQPSGNIAVGTVNSIGIYVLPELLKRFNDEFPEVKVGIVFKLPGDLVNEVRAGKLDFALLTADRQYNGLRQVPIQKFKMFLVAPRDHPLATSEEIQLSDIEQYPFVGYEQGMQSRAMMDALFQRMSLKVNYVMESSNVATIKHMAMAGLGLAILPEPTVAAEIRRGLLVRPPVPALYMTQDITAYYKDNRTLSPAKREFLKVLQMALTRKRPVKR